MYLLTMIPYRDDANLGRAYNEAMALLPDEPDTWAIFLDHDATPTTGRWWHQFREAILTVPDAGAIVACTNRIAAAWQRAGDRVINDIAWHRQYGKQRARVRTLLDITETRGWGGVMFALNRAAWQEAGGFADGLGCVDHSIHHRMRAKGRRMYLHQGLYVYHWRHFGEADPTRQHPKAPNCPCQAGDEKVPTVEVQIK